MDTCWRLPTAASQATFVSSTYWTEAIGPAAALATLARFREVDVPAHVARIGDAVRDGWRRLGAARGLEVKVGGIPALATLGFGHGEDSRALLTLFTQEMLDRGFLAGGGFYPTWAHTPAAVEAYLAAVEATFRELRARLDHGDVRAALRGPVAHSGFARLN